MKMASGDYRSCDVCNCKCFYDANLNYEHSDESEKKKTVLYNGKDSYMRLDWLGAWAVLCDDCSETHSAIIVKK